VWGAFAALALLGPAQAEEMRWETDLAQARARAAEEGRPLLVVFR
jgi:hypothetical protein